jgi:flagellar protein FliS
MPRDAYLESRVLGADPVELIHILYEHTLEQVKSARAALAAGDIAGRAQAVTKALAALGELEGSLDHNAGGSISGRLAMLYQYMRKRLVEGSVKREDKALAEVEALLRTAVQPYSYAAAESVAHAWSA